MHGVYIYKRYYTQRQLQREGKIRQSSDEEKHKAKVAMEMIMRFTQQGKKESEEIDMTQFKFTDFLIYIQYKMGTLV